MDTFIFFLSFRLPLPSCLSSRFPLSNSAPSFKSDLTFQSAPSLKSTLHFKSALAYQLAPHFKSALAYQLAPLSSRFWLTYRLLLSSRLWITSWLPFQVGSGLLIGSPFQVCSGLPVGSPCLVALAFKFLSPDDNYSTFSGYYCTLCNNFLPCVSFIIDEKLQISIRRCLILIVPI